MDTLRQCLRTQDSHHRLKSSMRREGSQFHEGLKRLEVCKGSHINHAYQECEEIEGYKNNLGLLDTKNRTGYQISEGFVSFEDNQEVVSNQIDQSIQEIPRLLEKYLGTQRSQKLQRSQSFQGTPSCVKTYPRDIKVRRNSLKSYVSIFGRKGYAKMANVPNVKTPLLRSYGLLRNDRIWP
ncbi:hypothetical protein SK128_026263, partial [Halocaridina rubra]